MPQIERSFTPDEFRAAVIRRGSDLLLSALWRSHPRILRHLRDNGRQVAPQPQVNRGGRPVAWPDCPDHQRGEYARLAKRLGGHNARRVMEDGQ